jgi:hypothetical protein
VPKDRRVGPRQQYGPFTEAFRWTLYGTNLGNPEGLKWLEAQ